MGENNLSDKKKAKCKIKLVVKYLYTHLSSIFRKKKYWLNNLVFN
jgi:hypothetical protein